MMQVYDYLGRSEGFNQIFSYVSFDSRPVRMRASFRECERKSSRFTSALSFARSANVLVRGKVGVLASFSLAIMSANVLVLGMLLFLSGRSSFRSPSIRDIRRSILVIGLPDEFSYFAGCGWTYVCILKFEVKATKSLLLFDRSNPLAYSATAAVLRLFRYSGLILNCTLVLRSMRLVTLRALDGEADIVSEKLITYSPGSPASVYCIGPTSLCSCFR